MSEQDSQYNRDNEIEKDFFSLLKVAVVKRHLLGQIDQAKEIFKDHIKNFFLENPSKVIPFPGKYSSEYVFELKRVECGDGDFKWKVLSMDEEHLPSEKILPFSIIKSLADSAIDSDNTNQLVNVVINGYTYNVYYIKALSDYVVGIVQRLSNELRATPDDFMVFDTTQYTDLPENQKMKVFNWYLENYPALRKKVLFEFFTNLLPDSEELRKII
jgi:hypothetical protein